MAKLVREIMLSQIALETSFRDEVKDLSLEPDINRYGIRVPLIVEDLGTGKYVLVDGYRRFYALDFLGRETAECIVESATSIEGRIIKRLGKE